MRQAQTQAKSAQLAYFGDQKPSTPSAIVCDAPERTVSNIMMCGVSCPGCVPDVANDLTWQPDAAFGTARGPEDYQAPRTYQFTVGLTF